MGYQVSGGTFDTTASGVLAHNKTSGLGNDDHSQYLLLAGRSGSQFAFGGTNAADDFYLGTTTHGTKGNFFFGNSTYDEANNRLGLGTLAPTHSLTLANGTSWSSYNTTDQTTNYQRVIAGWSASVFQILATAAGSLAGSVPDVDIGSAFSFLRLHGSSGGGFIDIGGASGGIASFVVLSDGTSLRFRSRITTSTNAGLYFENSAIGGNGYSASTGTQRHANLDAVWQQSGNAGYDQIYANSTESSVGSGTRNLLRLQKGAADRFTVSSAGVVNAFGQIASTTITTSTPSGTTQTLDFNTGNFQILSLASATGTVTVTLSNMLAGARYAIKVVQGAGARNATFTGVKWPASTAPTITAANGAVDMIFLDYDGTTAYGTFSQNMG